MTIAAAFCILFLCAGISNAQDRTAPVIACNLKAIRVIDRPRYSALMERLRAAIQNRSELPDGYVFFGLDGEGISVPEIAEWIDLERRCCPFLTFQLSVSGAQTGWLLKLTGPEGVKALLQAEFPVR